MPTVQLLTATVANAGSTSAVFSPMGRTILGIYFPAGVLGARVALLKGTAETEPLRLVYDETGVAIRPKIVADSWLELHPFIWKSVRHAALQLCDDAGAAVVQNADRDLLVEVG